MLPFQGLFPCLPSPLGKLLAHLFWLGSGSLCLHFCSCHFSLLDNIICLYFQILTQTPPSLESLFRLLLLELCCVQFISFIYLANTKHQKCIGCCLFQVQGMPIGLHSVSFPVACCSGGAPLWKQHSKMTKDNSREAPGLWVWLDFATY